MPCYPEARGGEGAAYNGLYGEAPPKRATFFPRGVSPMMAYAGRLRPKGVLFQASGI